MRKLMNTPEGLVRDELNGYAKIHQDKIRLIPDTTFIVRATPKEKGKVKLFMGNGAGHEPAVIGWVGDGMFEINVVGDVFTAPSADKMVKGMEAIDDGSPILICVQNHAGDVMNANMAYAKAKKKGLDVHKVLFYDDIASAPKEIIEKRRGMAGMLFYGKIVGAMAEAGASIEDCMKMFDYLEDNDLIEMGMGIHGEGGGDNRFEMPAASVLAQMVADILLADKPYKAGEKLLVMVNGAGSTTCMELNIFYNELDCYLQDKGLYVVGCNVGNSLTTQELAGLSVSICSVDNEMLNWWEKPCCCGMLVKK